LIVVSFVFPKLNAQTGPGGVGSASNVVIWLDASSISSTNGASISSWSDISGNNNHLNQASSTFQPTWQTNELNGLPAIRFDGIDDRLDFTSNVTANAITSFMVYSSTSVATRTSLTLANHIQYSSNRSAQMIYISPEKRVAVPRSNNVYSTFMFSTGPNSTSGTIQLSDGLDLTNSTRTSLWNNSTSTLGAKHVNGFYNLFFQGEVAELIIYNEELGLASKNIVRNYLASKYDITAPTDLYSHDTSFGFGLIGIGEESDGAQTVSEAKGLVKIENPTLLGVGDYLLLGHNNLGFSTNTSVPNSIVERWSQIWRVDLTGTPGNIDITFDLSSNGFAGSTDYALLLETVDGNFGNGGVTVITDGVFDNVSNTLSFSNVTLPEGTYFTLGEKKLGITPVSSGNWSTSSIWSCNCVPSFNDVVTISSPFNVNITGANAEVGTLTIENGASLSIAGVDSLKIFTDLNINGPLLVSNGTLAAVGQTLSQSFTNGSGINVDLSNLYVSTQGKLNLASGGWSISNTLRVADGQLDATGADSVVLISNSTTTAQILESVSNAFVGDFIVQRYISSRTANYANLSAPTSDATVADLDDDLILSGVNGNNGTALTSSGNIFRSIYSHWFNNDGPLTDVTTPLLSGIGHEVYLATTSTNFSGGTIDYRGTPTSGKASQYFFTKVGWNLFGNPFQAHIAYDSVDKVIWVPNNYYIYNSDNGSYDFFTGTNKPLIAPGQAFWINTSSAGKLFEILEEDKVTSSSSAILRTKRKKEFTVRINNNIGNYSHETSFNFSPFSIVGRDNYDALYLPSPVSESPAIYSKAANSEDKLIYNSLNINDRSQSISLSVKAGIDATHTLSFENISEMTNIYDCAYLQDHLEGTVIDLNFQQQYVFESTAGETDRFQLILSNNFDNCQNLMKDQSRGSVSYTDVKLRSAGNNWFVDYSLEKSSEVFEINIYNMMGQKVAGTIRTTLSKQGSVPLTELQNLKGIFVIRVHSKNHNVSQQIRL